MHQGSARVYCLPYLSKLEQNKSLTSSIYYMSALIYYMSMLNLLVVSSSVSILDTSTLVRVLVSR